VLMRNGLFDVSALPSGVYQVLVQINGFRHTEKLVVEH
jgi:hypothetical protein